MNEMAFHSKISDRVGAGPSVLSAVSRRKLASISYESESKGLSELITHLLNICGVIQRT